VTDGGASTISMLLEEKSARVGRGKDREIENSVKNPLEGEGEH